MESNRYSKVCKEVLAVLDRAPETQLDLIPNHIIDHLRNISRKTEDIELKFDGYGNPILSKDARAMIVIIYQKYFLDDNLRTSLTNKLLENDKKGV